MFEIEVKQAMDRYEERVRELQLERQLPHKAQTNAFLSLVKVVKAAVTRSQLSHAETTRRTLATK